jgi:Ca2+-transporting ATPase
MNFWAGPASEALRELGSSDDGLSHEEAARRLKEFGRNEFAKSKPASALSIFINQFKSFVVLILVAALAVSALLGEWVDAIVIGVIVVFNALFGTYQEYRAEKAMEALQKMTAPQAKVLRGGHAHTLLAAELVPGDVILLDAGDSIPADARLIKAFGLFCNEASLTGESVADEKTVDAVPERTPLGDHTCMVHAQTTVTAGRGVAVVTATGMATEIGKIAGLIQSIRETETPMTKRLDELGKKLGMVVLVICVLLFVTEVVETPVVLNAFLSFSGDIAALAASLKGTPIVDLLLVAVSLAVSAIPEGLPAIVTVTLALGLKRMAHENAVVRKLPAVETLGSTTCICTDKTGTLTRNEMMVTRLYAGGKEFQVTGDGYKPNGAFSAPLNDEAKQLLHVAVHCNDAEYVREDADIIGDPTEGALLVAAEKAKLRAELPRVDEIPFDSVRKRMTTIHNSRGLTAFMKGAPETVLEVCDYYLEGGKEVRLTQALRDSFLKHNMSLASQALRVLGFAYKCLKPGYDRNAVESGMVFVGLAGMMDPPRHEAKHAIALCRTAGIKVVMMTGDNKATAVAVGEALGLMPEGAVALTGVELDEMTDGQLQEVANDVAVFARVSPEHKLRVVKALQARGHVVAVTGDGVNDAPALKTADIGVAMGVTGTDVAKEASDLVLRDDNFATIVKAVEEGRRIYANIRNFIKYLLSANFDEIAVVAFSAFAGWPLPFLPVQILWLNLVSDGFPALALGLDSPDPHVMGEKPRPKEQSVFNGMLHFIVITGAIAALASLVVFWYGLQTGSIERARTLAFTTSVFFELLFVFSCRSPHHSVFNAEFLSNKWLFGSVGLGLALQLIIIYVPFFNPLFGTAPLGLWDWALVLALSSLGMLPILGNMWRERQAG